MRSLGLLLLVACSNGSPEEPVYDNPIWEAVRTHDVPTLTKLAEAEPEKCATSYEQGDGEVCEATLSLVSLCRFESVGEACLAYEALSKPK